MPQHAIWWIIVCLDILLIGVTKSGFGGGVGLIVVPIMAIALGHLPGRGTEAALGLLLPLLIAGDLIAVSQYRKLFFHRTDPPPQPSSAPMSSPKSALSGEAAKALSLTPAQTARKVVIRLLPGSVVGIVIGGLLLYALHSSAELVNALIRIEIGLESIVLVSLHWWRQWKGMQQRLMPEPWRSHLTGGFSAISSTLAHAAGPIVTMYLLPLRLDRQLYVGTCAVYFFLLNTAKLPAYYQSRLFDHAELSFTLRFLPLVFAGALLGRWMITRLNDQTFSRIVYVLTFGLGWYILADGILNLFGIHIS